MANPEDTPKKKELTEAEAEELLEEMLDDPRYRFLIEHKKHADNINSADSAHDALTYVRSVLAERDARTFEFRALKEVPGVSFENIKVEGVRAIIEFIKNTQKVIGDGNDAVVVVSKLEQDYSVCYKFAKQEATPRGRNTFAEEALLQGDAYDVAVLLEDSRISVPTPYYVTELGSEKLLAMETLRAHSVDDIMLGKGEVPDWLDIDEFCVELKTFLEMLHDHGIFHRDMHVGNVMVRQEPEPPADGKWGYIIDFGLSGKGINGLEPYKKERAGQHFTYSDDCAIIEIVRQGLKNVRASKEV